MLRIIPQLIIVILFSIANPSYGQNSTVLIDSLLQQLTQAKSDTAKLSKILTHIETAKIWHLPQVDSIAKTIHIRFKAKGYTLGELKAKSTIATIHYKKGDFRTALQQHKELLEKLPNGSNNHLKAITFKFITGEYLNLGLFDSAIIYGENAIVAFQEIADSSNIAQSLNLLGGIYWNKGELSKASEKLYQSLTIRQKIKDTLGAANNYNNIGLIFDSQGKLNEALDMYNKALVLYQKINNEQGAGRAYNNIAIVKKSQKKYSESIEMYLKSLEIDKKQNNIDDLGKTLNNIGALYLDLNDIENGIDHLNQARNAFIKSGNQNGTTAVYINLGRAFLLKKNYTQAEQYYQKAHVLAQKIGSNEWLRDSNEGLYRISKATGNTAKALQYHELYMQLNDTLRSLENLNKLDHLNIEFETKQKEKEIALLSKNKELNDLKLKRQKLLSHLLLSIAVSAIVIIILSSLYVRHLRSDKQLLLLKNAEITQQNEEIQAQRDMLESANAELTQQKEELQAQSDQIGKQSTIISGVNRRMTEGLEYASIIQQALLPNTQIFKNYFNNHFVIYKPKDIVSGDLYWAWEKDGSIIFTIADCTGHGVAGAFVSIMAISILKDAIGVKKLYDPEKIADFLYTEMVKGSAPTQSSIIDIDFTICKYTPSTKQFVYSGNRMNFFIARNNQVELVKVRQAQNSSTPHFSNCTMQLAKSDKLYFYTDGYTDQLNGVNRQKMGRKELHKIIETITTQPYPLHQAMIDGYYRKWKGAVDQVDDVLILSLEV